MFGPQQQLQAVVKGQRVRLSVYTRFDLLVHIKKELKDSGEYEKLINKSVLGLFSNPNFEVGDVDLILIPESSSTLNFDLANKIKNKIPFAFFLKDGILKNEPENVTLDYDMLNGKGFTQDTISGMENMVQNASVGGIFKIVKIPSRFRKYVVNFLKMDDKNRRLLNKLVDRKIIVVDDFASQGTEIRDLNRLLENYAPKEIIIFSLIGNF